VERRSTTPGIMKGPESMVLLQTTLRSMETRHLETHQTMGFLDSPCPLLASAKDVTQGISVPHFSARPCSCRREGRSWGSRRSASRRAFISQRLYGADGGDG